MIGQLTGLIAMREADHCLVDVCGVGYVVFASSQTLARLPDPPEAAVVLIETLVREDAITLYGFSTAEERGWFRLLTTVQGVGAKVALAILSACPPQTMAAVIASADKAQLTRAAGVGPRLAARILSELAGKHVVMTTQTPYKVGVNDQEVVRPIVATDAMIALEGLGFRRAEVWDILMRVIAAHPQAELDKVIGLTLKELGR